jgi:hypothetical protein
LFRHAPRPRPPPVRRDSVAADSGSATRPEQRRRQCCSEERRGLLLPVPVGGGGVRRKLPCAFESFRASISTFPATPVREALIEPKCKFFAWLVLHGKILTADNTLKRNWACNHSCSLCLCMNETSDHLILGCNFSEAVWNVVAARFQLPGYHDLPIRQGPGACVTAIISTGSKKEKQQKLGANFLTWWMVRRERNRRIF